MISLYFNKETNFTNNGNVILSDCISCLVIEELNGLYECCLEYPLDSRGKWKYLLEDNIIKVDNQLFRIYNKSKNLKSIKVNARHIFYDLLDNLIGSIDIRGLTGSMALDKIMTNTAYSHKFTHISDISTINTIDLYDEAGDIVDKNPVEAIFKLINIYSADLFRDNYNIRLLGVRGIDRGLVVRYGKNIRGIEENLDTDGICTRIKPIDQDGWTLPELYVDSPYIDSFANPKIKVITFKDVSDENDLRATTQQYFINSKCDTPQFNYKIDFLELTKTDEYKNYSVLERVYLGDTVTIKHTKLNINLKARVIKVTKNALTKRIEKIELGSFKLNIASDITKTIQEVKKDIVKVTSDYKKAIDNATALITGSKGGNVVIRQNNDKKPYEILIMDTTDVMTAGKVWRWNLGGFGYSNTGVNGPYETAITMDGHIVASFITALEIHGEQITAGILKSKTGGCELNLNNNTFKLGDKLIFDGEDLKFGSGVTLLWDQVIGAPTVLSANDIKSTVITKEYIGTLDLLVGREIQMGENTRISWDNVDSKPYIPSEYKDSQAVKAWVDSGYKTHIDDKGVYTGTVIASKILGGEISGTTIKTSNTSNYIHLKNQWSDYYNEDKRLMSIGYFKLNLRQVEDSDFYIPSINFGNLPTGETDADILNKCTNFGTINYFEKTMTLGVVGDDLSKHCAVSLNGHNGTIDFSGKVNFESATVSGLNTDSMISYINDKVITVNQTPIQPVSISFATVKNTNIKMFLAIHCVSDSIGTMFIDVKIDSKSLAFSPKQIMQVGDNIISIPLAVFQVQTGGHLLGISLTTSSGVVTINQDNMQLILESGGLKGGVSPDFPHGEIIQKIIYTDVNNGKLTEEVYVFLENKNNPTSILENINYIPMNINDITTNITVTLIDI